MQKVIILSGPSGVGKNTLGDALMQQFPKLAYSVSATTRPKRDGEVDGKDYHFISVEDFKAKIAQDEFLEWQEVYQDNFYGTLKSELDRINQLDKFPLLVIDVYGAINIMKNLKFKPLSIFIDCPSLDIIKQRLEKRGTDSPEKIAKRIEKASQEIYEKKHFDIAIVNDDLNVAQQQLYSIVNYFLNYCSI